MTHLRKHCLLLFAFFILIISAGGCSSVRPLRLSSVLEIGTDETGERRITMTAEKETLAKLFGSSDISFQSFIEANCPSAFSWSYRESASAYTVDFLLSFSSLDEYQEKLSLVTGLSDAAAVSRPSVGVKTGFSLSENVELVQLFSWFKDALAARTKMSDKTLSRYFSADENLLYYGGRLYPQESGKLSCHVETLHDARSIDILTDFSLEGGWQRTVQIEFPPEMLSNASNVRSYLSGLLPEGVSEKWKSNTYWQLVFSGGELAQISRQMGALFQSLSGESITETIVTEENLKVVHTLEEPLNLAFFVPDGGECRVRYYLGSTGGAAVIPFAEDGSRASLPFSDPSSYQGYLCVFDRQVTSDTRFSCRLEFSYQPENLLMHTSIRALQDMARVTTAEYAGVPALHRSCLQGELSRRAEDLGVIEFADTETGFAFIFTQAGTPLWLTAGWRVLSGSSETLVFDSDGISFFSPNESYHLRDSLDFSDFLISPRNTQITCSYIFPDQTEVQEGFSFTDTDTCRYLTGSSSLTFITTEGKVDLNVPLTGINPIFPWVILTAVIGGGAILYIIAVILISRGLSSPPEKTPAKSNDARKKKSAS